RYPLQGQSTGRRRAAHSFLCRCAAGHRRWIGAGHALHHRQHAPTAAQPTRPRHAGDVRSVGDEAAQQHAQGQLCRSADRVIQS
nr:hypothetical protein [Tanacetum cinerariifolium]